jgi:four helix bundle protein
MKDEINPKPTDLKIRTKQFALRIIRLYSELPSTTVAQTLGKQLLRSGTSVGAQYREGIRSRSDAEIISKWSGSLQELEETAYWLELLVESKIFPSSKLSAIIKECDELIAILTTCVKKIKSRKY